MTYTIEFKRVAYQFATVKVEAASEKEARSRAQAQMDEDGVWNFDWETDGTEAPTVHNVMFDVK